MKIKEACDIVLAQADLQPKKDASGKIIRTYCNVGVNRILNILGVKHFDGLLANQIYDKCSKEFDKISEEDAFINCMQGFAVLSVWKNPTGKSGHCAVLYPVDRQKSGSWKRFVPMIANIGEKNGVMRVSQAYRETPDYFFIG